MTDNPLLREGDPAFAEIEPTHVAPAVACLLADAEAALERAVGDGVEASFDAMSAVLDVAVERLDRVWGHVVHLQSVADSPELRTAHGEALPRITAFRARLGCDVRLFAKYRQVMAREGASLGPARRRVLEHALRDFVLGGAELEGPARERFRQVQQRLAELSQRFGENVLDATDAFALDVPESDLAGVPDDVRQAARDTAAEAGQVWGCRLTLQEPCYFPVMRFAENRALRERLFTAYHTRSSDLGEPRWDNSALIEEILALRAEQAALLGRGSYADLSLVPKMAESPAQVIAFLADLAQRARATAERERDELRAFAATELGLSDLLPWDRAFASEKLRQARHGFSAEEVKRYFPEPVVLRGLSGLLAQVFGIELREAASQVWHPSVRFYEVRREGETIGGLYLDLHARRGKQSGAWMDNARQRWRRPDSGALQLPLTHVVCNFAAPTGDKPALLDHDDLITLFHEFGHALHHLLGRADDLGAGFEGVEWDAIELPSQFMENFCWNWDVLQRLSAHEHTGEPLARSLFDRMLGARNFQTGLGLVRMVEYGLFDMRLHAEPGPPLQPLALADAVRREVAVLEPAPFQRMPHSFTHVFDGGYAAGFYGYQWAEVMSADAFEAFEEAGVFDAEVGRRYRQTILEAGSERPSLENFTRFRGRSPRIDAFLRHQGIACVSA